MELTMSLCRPFNEFSKIHSKLTIGLGLLIIIIVLRLLGLTKLNIAIYSNMNDVI